MFLSSFHLLFHNRNVKKTSPNPSKGGECLTDRYGSLKLKYFELWTTNFSNYANVYCNVIRVIRVIRSLVAFVFMQKYVIEVYVSVSFCLRAIRVIRSLVDSVFVQFMSFVVLLILSSCKNMSLKYMSLCHSVFLSHSVCQMFSQSASQSGTNSVRINGFLVCKRCPLRRLLTPFWSPIKHLLKSVFATTW